MNMTQWPFTNRPGVQHGLVHRRPRTLVRPTRHPWDSDVSCRSLTASAMSGGPCTTQWRSLTPALDQRADEPASECGRDSEHPELLQVRSFALAAVNSSSLSRPLTLMSASFSNCAIGSPCLLRRPWPQALRRQRPEALRRQRPEALRWQRPEPPAVLRAPQQRPHRRLPSALWQHLRPSSGPSLPASGPSGPAAWPRLCCWPAVACCCCAAFAFFCCEWPTTAVAVPATTAGGYCAHKSGASH